MKINVCNKHNNVHPVINLKKVVHFMATEQRLAISYCRKSTKVKGKSVEESVGYQQQKINTYAKQKGLEIIREFSDVGYSGKNTDRPELKEMVEYLRTTEMKIEELIIYSINRFGRDLQHNIKQMLVISNLVPYFK